MGLVFFNMRVAKQISDVKISWAIVEKYFLSLRTLKQ
jgi:hypothetical protein